jgi:hypothetical protein
MLGSVGVQALGAVLPLCPELRYVEYVGIARLCASLSVSVECVARVGRCGGEEEEEGGAAH